MIAIRNLKYFKVIIDADILAKFSRNECWKFNCNFLYLFGEACGMLETVDNCSKAGFKHVSTITWWSSLVTSRLLAPQVVSQLS